MNREHCINYVVIVSCKTCISFLWAVINLYLCYSGGQREERYLSLRPTIPRTIKLASTRILTLRGASLEKHIYKIKRYM